MEDLGLELSIFMFHPLYKCSLGFFIRLRPNESFNSQALEITLPKTHPNRLLCATEGALRIQVLRKELTSYIRPLLWHPQWRTVWHTDPMMRWSLSISLSRDGIWLRDTMNECASTKGVVLDKVTGRVSSNPGWKPWALSLFSDHQICIQRNQRETKWYKAAPAHSADFVAEYRSSYSKILTVQKVAFLSMPCLNRSRLHWTQTVQQTYVEGSSSPTGL